MHESQLPESVRINTQKRICEIEQRKPLKEEQPDVMHGAPHFITQLSVCLH